MFTILTAFHFLFKGGMGDILYTFSSTAQLITADKDVISSEVISTTEYAPEGLAYPCVLRLDTERAALLGGVTRGFSRVDQFQTYNIITKEWKTMNETHSIGICSTSCTHIKILSCLPP